MATQNSIFNAFISFIGTIPRLSIAAIMLLVVLISTSLIKYVSLSNGLNVILEFNTYEATIIMSSCIFIILLSVSIRIHNVNKILIYKLNKAEHLTTKDLQQDIKLFSIPKNVQSILKEFSFKGNIFSKLKSLVEWHPEPFAILITFLTLIWVVGIMIFYSEPTSQLNYNHSWLWRYYPWLTISFVSIYLVVNDYWVVSQTLEITNSMLKIQKKELAYSKNSDSFSLNAPSNSSYREEIIDEISERLTITEKIVYQKRIIEKKPLKNIASEMYVSLSTIKTHINNINKKISAKSNEC
ncbi:MAG: helix-turn-helix transcriptional regulator [Saprospiraceae bacterium]|nr:helix-turn-helix transcriptional regulator [Saprospiraceae bacterium]